MELRQLRHFVVLAEEVHYGRAAERLCISQPALSASIQRLEQDLDVRLFERDSKSVRITLSGEVLLSHALEMLSNADRARSISRALSEGRLGRIEIGFTSIVLFDGLHDVVQECRNAFPDIDIVLREVTSQKQGELIRTGRLDGGLVSLPMPPAGLDHIALFSDQYVVCLPVNHPLARHKSIDIAALRNERFVLQTRELFPNVYDYLIGLCTTAGFHPQVGVESAHVLSTVALVARGMGVALVPESVAHFKLDGVVLVPQATPPQRRRGFFVWLGSRKVPGMETLIAHITTHVEARKASVTALPVTPGRVRKTARTITLR